MSNVHGNVVGADFIRRHKIFAWDSIKGRRATGRRFMLVREWFRDCDMAERTSLKAIPATRRHFMDAQKSLYEGAEGPCTLDPVKPSEMADVLAECGIRDLVLEAFEDGHAHVVYPGSR